MSEYRPWGPQLEEDVEPVAEEATADAQQDEVYVPWAPGSGPLVVDVPKQRRFEAPPGLGAPVPRRKGDNAYQTAAATLLWTGGFVLFTAIAAVAVVDALIEQAIIYGEHPDDMRGWRAGLGWAIPASALFIVPGVGLLYHQAWARPLGLVAASFTLLLGPVGLVLGIVGLVALARMEAP